MSLSVERGSGDSARTLIDLHVELAAASIHRYCVRWQPDVQRVTSLRDVQRACRRHSQFQSGESGAAFRWWRGPIDDGEGFDILGRMIRKEIWLLHQIADGREERGVEENYP